MRRTALTSWSSRWSSRRPRLARPLVTGCTACRSTMGRLGYVRCEDAAMGEYGRIVGEGSGAVGGGRGSDSTDEGGDVMGVFSNLLDQIGALPVEVFVVLAAVVMIGGVVMSLRPS